jgi:RimJ/RimL family protein N-acetyltransferase
VTLYALWRLEFSTEMAACIAEDCIPAALPEGVKIIELLDGPVDASRISIRLTNEEDLANVAFLANDVGVSAFLRDRFPSPYTMDDAKRFYALQESQRTDPENCMDHLFSVTIDNIVVGGCGLHLGRAEARHTAQMGYWLGRPYWKHGIAAIAVKLLLEYAWPAFPGLVRIEAVVMAP